MPIDTLALRESSLLDVMITPDGTIDQGDRMSLLGQFNSMAAIASAGDNYPSGHSFGNSLYKPAHYAPLRYAPARFRPPRYKKPF